MSGRHHTENTLQQERITSELAGIELCFDEPLASYTSFKIGGPADLLIKPQSESELDRCFAWSRKNGIPVLLMGGGTNLLISDRGVRGVVICLTSLNKITVENNVITAQAGAAVKDVSEAAAEKHLSGLEFIYGMPGTIGGAAWMNARCYGGEIADVLAQAAVLKKDGNRVDIECDREKFSYKRSPFQAIHGCITEVSINLEPGSSAEIKEKMSANLKDREDKGHFQHPSAGSLFKNDRSFGAPTGKILDDLGLRGTSSGGAQIAPFHGNIFINRDGATATDVLDLIVLAKEKARKALHIELDPEIRLVGDWLPGELARL